MAKQRTFKLSEPVVFAGQEYKELTFRKLKVKHLLNANIREDSNPVVVLAELMAASAGVDPGVIHEIDFDDFNKIQELMGDFFLKAAPANPQPTSGG